MNLKVVFVAILVFQTILVTNCHTIAKRDAEDDIETTTRRIPVLVSQFLNNLRERLSNVTFPSIQINEMQMNVTELRLRLKNATSDAMETLSTQLQTMSRRLNDILRQTADNDSNLVNRLYEDIVNRTRDGVTSANSTLRQAFTTATKTMAENYSGLANNSLQIANDLVNQSRQLFRKAMIRAGNDTNRAVIAVNTAIDAIRNNSLPLNISSQQIAANLVSNVQQLSERLRGLVNRTAVASGVQINTNPEFRQKTKEALQTLMTNMNELGENLRQMTTNVINGQDSNNENNNIDVIGTVSRKLSQEKDKLRAQIQALRDSNTNDNNNDNSN